MAFMLAGVLRPDAANSVAQVTPRGVVETIMENEDIWKYGFFAFVACSGISTFCVFQISRTNRLWAKVIMRAAVLSLFYSPCILAGEGGAAIAPVGVVYLFILSGILAAKTYLAGAIIWMTVSFSLLTWYFYTKYKFS